MSQVRTWSAINISEGKNTRLLNQLEEILKPFAFEKLLIEPDANYHRTVITLIGPLALVFKAIDAITPLILAAVDLNVHKGSHYRMGAIDVIPFVFEEENPALKESVISWAQTYAATVPVYFYGQLSPTRPTVGSIRRGGLESLLRRIEKGFASPDLGGFPSLKSGVTAVGIRPPLAAFNMRVKTTETEILRPLVVGLREQEGGFKGLMSALFPVDKTAVDLSFNLTDLKQTSMKDVFDQTMVQLKALNIELIESTLVGCIAKETLFKGFKSKNLSEIEAYYQFSSPLENKVIDWSSM